MYHVYSRNPSTSQGLFKSRTALYQNCDCGQQTNERRRCIVNNIIFLLINWNPEAAAEAKHLKIIGRQGIFFSLSKISENVWIKGRKFH